MDTKRKNSQADIAAATRRIMQAMREFRPDLVMLGRRQRGQLHWQSAARYRDPVVFWGINGLPLKYGLVDRWTGRATT